MNGVEIYVRKSLKDVLKTEEPPDDALVEYLAGLAINDEDDDETEIREATESFLQPYLEEESAGQTDAFVDGLLEARAKHFANSKASASTEKMEALVVAGLKEREALSAAKEPMLVARGQTLSEEERRRREKLFEQYGVDVVETDDLQHEDTFFKAKAASGDSGPALARNDNRAAVKAAEDRRKRQMAAEHEKKKEQEREAKLKKEKEAEKEKQRTQKKGGPFQEILSFIHSAPDSAMSASTEKRRM